MQGRGTAEAGSGVDGPSFSFRIGLSRPARPIELSDRFLPRPGEINFKKAEAHQAAGRSVPELYHLGHKEVARQPRLKG